MAEFLGAGDAGTSRFIYSRTLLLQAMLASIATAGGIVWVLHGAPVGYALRRMAWHVLQAFAGILLEGQDAKDD